MRTRPSQPDDSIVVDDVSIVVAVDGTVIRYK